MNENYPSDVRLDDNPDGTVSFATDVVATIAGLAVTEVDGVASMSSPASGLADMFSRKNTRNFTKGVRIDLEGNKVMVDITIVVEYGSPVPEVALNIQENVKKAIETMSGLDVHSVDVHVVGVSFEREQRAAKELDEQQKKMLEQAESATAEEVEEETVQAASTGDEDADFNEDDLIDGLRNIFYNDAHDLDEDDLDDLEEDDDLLENDLDEQESEEDEETEESDEV